MVSELITSAKAAELAGVSIATVSREVARGNLKVHWEHPGPSGMRLFKASEIERWITARFKASA